jgi:hypothetical protein
MKKEPEPDPHKYVKKMKQYWTTRITNFAHEVINDEEYDIGDIVDEIIGIKEEVLVEVLNWFKEMDALMVDVSIPCLKKYVEKELEGV